MESQHGPKADDISRPPSSLTKEVEVIDGFLPNETIFI
jgi:hypothetical protein